MQKVIGIDPGLSGAIILTDGKKFIETFAMPVIVTGKEKMISFVGCRDILKGILKQHGECHTFLERAIPMAMGSKGAFNYGRGFESVVLAITLNALPLTLIEPSRWAKEMHEGISSDLKPKVKSLIAARRLTPHLEAKLPRKPKGGHHDGFIDALLIALFGLRKFKPQDF